MTREEDISNDFLDTDRVYPPGLMPASFKEALVEVLQRLPDEAYDEISSRVSLVVETPDITAVNVPFSRVYPLLSGKLEVRFDTIVVFHQAQSLPHNALVGLLAHEFAHSFVSGKDYKSDEEATNALARQWGFNKELDLLEVELRKLA